MRFIGVLVHALVASACCIWRLILFLVTDRVTPGAADGVIVVTLAPCFTLTRFLFIVLLLVSASLASELVLNDSISK